MSVSESSSSSDERKDEKSKIHFRNVYDNNKMYSLSFTASDVIMLPVYLKPRVFEERDIDKSVQPRSEVIFQKKVNLKAKRTNVLHKSYRIDRSSDRISMMSLNKPLTIPRPIAAGPVKGHRSISCKKSSMEMSKIYLQTKDMKVVLYPGIVDIQKIRHIDQENREEQRKMLEDLGMDSTESLQNRASFIIKHKKDLFKITFHIADSVFEIVKVKMSQGVQASDENAYIKGFSEVTGRMIFYSVPRSMYDYVDPMIEIKEKNMAMKLKNMEPLWMYETRMKRLREYKLCRSVNPHTDIHELKIGSMICFEGNGSNYKARTGAINCSVKEDEYEKWVVGYQKIDYNALDLKKVLSEEEED